MSLLVRVPPTALRLSRAPDAALHLHRVEVGSPVYVQGLTSPAYWSVAPTGLGLPGCCHGSRPAVTVVSPLRDGVSKSQM